MNFETKTVIDPTAWRTQLEVGSDRWLDISGCITRIHALEMSECCIFDYLPNPDLQFENGQRIRLLVAGKCVLDGHIHWVGQGWAKGIPTFCVPRDLLPLLTSSPIGSKMHP